MSSGTQLPMILSSDNYYHKSLFLSKKVNYLVVSTSSITQRQETMGTKATDLMATLSSWVFNHT